MSPGAEILVFTGIIVLGQFSPGPDLILVTRTSLASGGRAGMWTALGITAGLAVHATLAIGGTAALLGRGGWLGTIVSWLAAAYLGWLGFILFRAAWRAEQVAAAKDGHRPQGDWRSWKRGLLCNLLNPKVALYLAAVGAPFLAGERPQWWPLAIWLVIVVEGLIGWTVWAWVLQLPPVRRAYVRWARWIDAGFGLALWALALKLALWPAS